MKILTLENKTYVLEKIPEYVDDKLRFAVLDNSNPADPDYFFIPLIFLESFNAPAAVLQIGKHKVQMPLDWKMIIGDPEQGELHVLPITSLNDRGFSRAVCARQDRKRLQVQRYLLTYGLKAPESPLQKHR